MRPGGTLVFERRYPASTSCSALSCLLFVVTCALLALGVAPAGAPVGALMWYMYSFLVFFAPCLVFSFSCADIFSPSTFYFQKSPPCPKPLVFLARSSVHTSPRRSTTEQRIRCRDSRRWISPGKRGGTGIRGGSASRRRWGRLEVTTHDPRSETPPTSPSPDYLYCTLPPPSQKKKKNPTPTPPPPPPPSPAPSRPCSLRDPIPKTAVHRSHTSIFMTVCVFFCVVRVYDGGPW